MVDGRAPPLFDERGSRLCAGEQGVSELGDTPLAP